MTFSDAVAEAHAKLIEKEIERIKDAISRPGLSFESYRFEIGKISALRRALEMRDEAVKMVEEA